MSATSSIVSYREHEKKIKSNLSYYYAGVTVELDLPYGFGFGALNTTPLRQVKFTLPFYGTRETIGPKLAQFFKEHTIQRTSPSPLDVGSDYDRLRWFQNQLKNTFLGGTNFPRAPREPLEEVHFREEGYQADWLRVKFDAIYPAVISEHTITVDIENEITDRYNLLTDVEYLEKFVDRTGDMYSLITDLDSTLFDVSRRVEWFLHQTDGIDWDRTGGVDWDGFYQSVHMDEPIRPNIRILHCLVDGFTLDEDDRHIDLSTIAMTGRSETTFIETLKQLRNNGIHLSFLAMRKDGCTIPDTELKGEVIDTLDLDPVRCIGVLEDRMNVVEMFRERKFTVLDLAGGKY